MSGSRPDPLPAAAAVLRLAARTFAVEVDPPFYQRLVEMCREPGVAGLQLEPMEAQLCAAPVPEALETLAVEYCRLFIGPRPACPPYASAQQGGATGGSWTMRTVWEICAEHRIEPRLPPQAPIAADDHAAIWLSVLAELYATAAEAGAGQGSAALAAGARLRDEYLLAWLPRFLAAVVHHSRCGPYRPVARATAALLCDPIAEP